jgi:hypothetical protein
MFKHALWGLWGVRNGFRLRIYGFTDLPPSLPLPPADPRTRTPESKRCRLGRRGVCMGQNQLETRDLIVGIPGGDESPWLRVIVNHTS